MEKLVFLFRRNKLSMVIDAMKDLFGHPLYANILGEAGRKRVQMLYGQAVLW